MTEARTTNARRILRWGVLAAVLGVLIWSLAGTTDVRGDTFEFALPDLDGRTVTRADFPGRVLVVDIWGTWCPPCREMVPHLVRLQEDLGDRGVQVIGIAFERPPPEEAPARVRAFAEQHGADYPMLLGNHLWLEETFREFQGFPTTVIVKPDGTVHHVEVGYPGPDGMDHLREEVEALLD